MPRTTPNLGLPTPDTHSDSFTPQEDIEALADGVDALAPFLGLSGPTMKRRGKSIIATEESRTNTAFGLMTTPDRVQNLVLPADGLIVVAFQAAWKESVLGAASAAIFLGANQVKKADVQAGVGGAPRPQAAFIRGSGAVDTYTPLATNPTFGLDSAYNASVAYSGDVATGQLVGFWAGGTVGGFGVLPMFAAAGTYDVSVQFQASSGSVTAKNRKLWAWTIGF